MKHGYHLIRPLQTNLSSRSRTADNTLLIYSDTVLAVSQLADCDSQSGIDRLFAILIILQYNKSNIILKILLLHKNESSILAK